MYISAMEYKKFLKIGQRKIMVDIFRKIHKRAGQAQINKWDGKFANRVGCKKCLGWNKNI